MNSGLLKSSILKSLVSWSPMLIPIVLVFLAERYTVNNFMLAVYDEKSGFLLEENPPERDTVKDSKFTLAVLFDETTCNIESDIDALGKYTEEAKTKYPKKVGDIVRNSFTRVEAAKVNVPRVNNLKPFSSEAKRRAAKMFNRISQRITNNINKSMGQSINKIAQDLETEIGNALDTLDLKSDNVRELAITKITKKLNEEEIRAQKYLSNTFLIFRWIKNILNILLIIAIVKSFANILARYLFRLDEGIEFTLADKKDKIKNGSLDKCPTKFFVSGTSKSIFYSKYSMSLTDHATDITCPQIFRCFFSRLFGRSLFMKKIDMTKKSKRVAIDNPKDREFVTYDLKKGEKCVFRFHSFVAMEKTVKLRTKYSFHLSSFLLDRFRFSMAEGPGKLVLVTNGNSIISPHGDSTKSTSIYKIVAFRNTANFWVESKLNIKNLFFSDYNLKKQNTANIIIDSMEHKKRVQGVIRFFWRFFIPF